VLDNLVEAGFMTEGQVFGARRNPANAVDRRDERSPNYYLDWAFDEIKKVVETLPKSVHERVFVVRLALDVDQQKNAEKAIENSLRQYGREYRAKQGAAVLMDIDGSVRAMVGGRDYGESQFNRATDALRQPGSSFKPYVYATALMNGFKPTSVVVDSPVCIGNWCPKNYGGGHSGAMTLTQAIIRSVNVIPVKLSIALGNGNPKIGRAKIRETAVKAGLRTPLPDTPSMPIGADEVTVLDHTGGYTIFPNLGKAMAPHAILEVRSGAGELIWRWDRDGKKPVQVITPQVAMDMNMMMSKVVEEGTARRAILDGIKAAGKTGTTNAYRDAWFVGFTGNFIAGVWFGNDDYTTMNQMTGGSLPAQTWHDIMAFAHQGVELKPIPGLGPQATGRQQVAEGKTKDGAPEPPSNRPSVLTKRGADALVRVERLMDDATRALAAGGSQPTKASDAAPARRQGSVASVSDQPPAGQIRGN
jgi:penicillin-binding protein 1A